MIVLAFLIWMECSCSSGGEELLEVSTSPTDTNDLILTEQVSTETSPSPSTALPTDGPQVRAFE
jgi:hypothetical protein